jgi:hypothetical protein
LIIIAAAWMCTLGIPHVAVAATNETAKADANRRTPLQRCDQLSEKAQIECLQKARERVVEARNKREASAQQKSAKGQGDRVSAPATSETQAAAPKKLPDELR